MNHLLKAIVPCLLTFPGFAFADSAQGAEAVTDQIVSIAGIEFEKVKFEYLQSGSRVKTLNLTKFPYFPSSPLKIVWYVGGGGQTLEDAKTYCAYLSKQEGMKYKFRFPILAEVNQLRRYLSAYDSQGNNVYSPYIAGDKSKGELINNLSSSRFWMEETPSGPSHWLYGKLAYAFDGSDGSVAYDRTQKRLSPACVAIERD